MIGDGDSSVHHTAHNGVPCYERHVQKLECTNHAIKCFRGHLEKLAKDIPQFQGKNGLTSDKVQQLCPRNEVCPKES